MIFHLFLTNSGILKPYTNYSVLFIKWHPWFSPWPWNFHVPQVRPTTKTQAFKSRTRFLISSRTRENGADHLAGWPHTLDECQHPFRSIPSHANKNSLFPKHPCISLEGGNTRLRTTALQIQRGKKEREGIMGLYETPLPPFYHIYESQVIPIHKP